MKFLTINGKLQKDANGKLITVSDNYENKLIKLNGKLLKHNNKLVKGGGGITPPSNTVTFKIKVENCPDFMADTEDTITATIGDKLEDVAGQSTILQQMTNDSGYYKSEAEIEGYATTIFTVNGSTNADIAFEGALSPTDIIDETWDGQIYYVIEAH